VYSDVRPLSCWYIYMLCFNPTGLICKALSLGIVQFQGKLCPFVPKNFNSDGSDLWVSGALQVVSEQRFCDLRLRHESCISCSCLGVLRANMKCDVFGS